MSERIDLYEQERIAIQGMVDFVSQKYATKANTA